MKNKEITCENCGEVSEVKIGHTFLGFAKGICPKCNHKNLYPLNQSTNILYGIGVIGIVLWVIYSAGTDSPVYPGLLFFGLVYALYKDNQLKKKAKLGIPKKIHSSIVKEPLASHENISLNQMPAYCHKCGKKLENEAKFCKNCGSKISSIN